jgi:hypothetical protein
MEKPIQSKFLKEVSKKDNPLPFPCPRKPGFLWDCQGFTFPWDSGEMGFVTVSNMVYATITYGSRIAAV